MATINPTKDPVAETILNNDSEEYPNTVVAKVETDNQQELTVRFQIRSILTPMAFKEKIGVFSQPGALPEDALVDLIDQIEDLDMDAVREEIEKPSDNRNHADSSSWATDSRAQQPRDVPGPLGVWVLGTDTSRASPAGRGSTWALRPRRQLRRPRISERSQRQH